MSYPRVKICCISSIEEAHLAVSAGASALGLVGPMPSGPGVISNETIASIVPHVPPGVASFLLTSETSAPEIIAHHHLVQTNVLQLVDAIAHGAYAAIKSALPSVKIVQVIHVISEASIEEALMAAEHADAILLDSGNPNLSVKELGGTGRVHNWQLSRKIREQIKKPLYLAGGLHPENVRQAIEVVEPFGLDLCSGVRSHGQLDPYKLELFFNNIYTL